jgi:two-component system, cell cycle sensor histidine kinase and response regulator CckA
MYEMPGNGEFKAGDNAQGLPQVERVEAKGGSKKCILFVDDDEMMVEMGKSMLEQFGYSVCTATNGVTALEMFQSRPQSFDLLITDHVMPKMKGMDLATAVLKIRPDIPIILCTGYFGEMSPSQALQAGIQAYLLKPFSLQELSSTLHRFLPLPLL